MDTLTDTRRLVENWRTYRRMLVIDRRVIPLDITHYERLIADLAFVIRSRLR